jgi:hypothetical protein
MKRRDPNGCRVVVHTTGKHALADVVDALQAFADQLRAQLESEVQDAA